MTRNWQWTAPFLRRWLRRTRPTFTAGAKFKFPHLSPTVSTHPRRARSSLRRTDGLPSSKQKLRACVTPSDDTTPSHGGDSLMQFDFRVYDEVTIRKNPTT